MFTLPADYLNTAAIQPLGIVLGHGINAEEWRGEFLTQIAEHFARKGARHTRVQQGRWRTVVQRHRHRLAPAGGGGGWGKRGRAGLLLSTPTTHRTSAHSMAAPAERAHCSIPCSPQATW